MTTFSFGETVVLIRRASSGRDVYGDDLFTEVETTLTNVPAWPTSSTEDASTVYDSVMVFLPPDTVVDAIDAVRVYGGRYEVRGRPERFVSPFSGFQPGLPVALERVT